MNLFIRLNIIQFINKYVINTIFHRILLNIIIKINQRKLLVDRINKDFFILITLKLIRGIMIIKIIILIMIKLIIYRVITIYGSFISSDSIKNKFHLFILQINNIQIVKGNRLFLIHRVKIIKTLFKDIILELNNVITK